MMIDPVLRSLFGKMEPESPGVLKLKAGQVVQGQVLKMLADNKALLQIGGVQVRAELQTPLQPGRIASLMVSPESTPEQIIFKTIKDASSPLHEDVAINLLQKSGLPDTPLDRLLLQTMYEEQLPLNKDQVGVWKQLLTRAGADKTTAPDWLKAAVQAHRRGLPLEMEVVSALKSALTGRPAHMLIQQLETDLKQWLNDLNGGKGQNREAGTIPGGPTAAETSDAGFAAAKAAAALVDALHELQNLTASITSPTRSANAGEEGGEAIPQTADSKAAKPVQEEIQTSSDSSMPKAPLSSGKNPMIQKHDIPPDAVRPSAAARADSPKEGAAVEKAESSQDGAAARNQVSPQSLPNSQLRDAQPLLRTLFQLLGAVHKEDGSRQGNVPASDTVDGSAPDTPIIKDLLSQVAAANAAPDPIRGQAAHLLDQISGQQMLMQSQQTGNLTHVLMFIPLIAPDGSQTASVQVQTRKSGNQPMDTQNCRLYFDLNMQYLGETLVDVLVQDRIVSLRMFNNHPQAEKLAELSRSALASGLEKLGYRFSSVKLLPYPDSVPASGGKGKMEGLALGKEPQVYRGLDVRI